MLDFAIFENTHHRPGRTILLALRQKTKTPAMIIPGGLQATVEVQRTPMLRLPEVATKHYHHAAALASLCSDMIAKE